MYHFKSILLILSTAIIASCDKCSNVLPPPNYFLFSITDSSGDDLFESTFVEPSFPRIDYHSALQSTISSQGYRAYYLSYPSFTNGATYYMKLSPTDTDTFSITYSVTEEKCYNDFKFVHFNYNGENYPLSNSNEIVVLK